MNRIRGRSPRFRLVLIILSLVLLLLLVSASLAVRSRLAASQGLMSRAQITQKASQYAQSNLPGSITNVRATRTTLGQVSAVACSFPGRLVSALTYWVRLDSYDLCSPATRVWLVELHGTFHLSNKTASYMRVVLDEKGNFIRADSGPLEP